MSSPVRRVILSLAAMAAMFGTTPTPLAAQEGGTIRGKVTAATSLRPLAGAQVSIPETGLGTLTNSAGEFLIVNVPAGQYTLHVQMLGYGREERPVTVTAGQAATVNFELEQQALALDEVVVTGTAGQARRREVGNSIAQLSGAEIQKPGSDVEGILQSASPGLVVTESAGMAGAGSSIRLRGSVSVSQSNQPLIYIDGVRVKSDAYKKNVPPVGYSGRSGNVTASPLGDINPADIERIEVIKGAAATTLYGTEAAAGVIQIFTKRGQAGAPRWTAQVNQGFARLRPFAPDVNPYLNMEPFLRDGWIQGYSGTVSGGSEDVQYFASAAYDNAEGVLPLDVEEKVSIRGNMTFTPLRDLQVTWNTSYANTGITNTPAGNNAHGLTLNAFRAERNYFGSSDPELLRTLLNQEITTDIHRFITGVTATYSPIDRFTNRLTVGYDLANQENRNLRPYGFIRAPEGILSDQRTTSSALTAEYVGSYQLDLTQDLATTLSFGGQSVTSEELVTTAYGEGFPGPGAPTVTGGANTLGFEDRLRVINAGFFGQALFGFKNRYFITTGMRVDGNSAFGEDLGLQAYPKVSGSYVISDEGFWPERFGSMKLRAAYGESGRAPGAFDAVRTWDPVGYGGQPAFYPRNLGNPELGPERTAEVEVGFDAAFLNERVTTEFTYYNQRTTDALLFVRHAPSEGFSDRNWSTSQLENVGTLRNSGIELAVNANVYDAPSWGLNLGGSVYTNDSEVVDLGGAVPFAAGNGWIEEGYPIMAARGTLIRNPGEVADPDVVVDHIFGPQQPTLVTTGSAALRLPRGIELSATGEYQGGHYIEDGASYNALRRSVRWPTCAEAYPMIDAGNLDQLTAWQRSYCISSNVRGNIIYPKDFFKLRDVTLRVPVGAYLPGSNSATLSLSGRNWYTWKNSDFLIFDPEMNSNSGYGDQNNAITEHIPPAASFIASLRVSF